MWLANFDDEPLEAPPVRRSPVFLPRRNDLDRRTEAEFKSRTRLSHAAYRELFALIEPDICAKLHTNHTIPTHTRLQMALRYMAQGPMYLTNADTYGVSKASMSIHINSVFSAISGKVTTLRAKSLYGRKFSG
jgi:hypothetical protein